MGAASSMQHLQQPFPLRSSDTIFRRALRNDTAFFHGEHFISSSEHFFQIVRDRQNGNAALARPLMQVGGNSLTAWRIEGGKGFVEQRDGRLRGKGAGNGDALQLAAGEFARPASGERFGLDNVGVAA